MKKLMLMNCLPLAAVIIISAQRTDFPKLTGPYLGQKPPGDIPAVFAPGVVSTERIEFGNAFSPDGMEFFFTRILGENNPAAIMHIRAIDGRWTPPEIASFSGKCSDVDPVLSPDGSRLFFSSNRPRKGAGKPEKDYDLWLVTRTESGWSEPVNPGSPLNSERDEFSPSVAKDGTIYFASDRNGGLGGIDFYCSRRVGGRYGEPENLGEAINTEYREGDGFISADGNIFIFSAFVPGNFGDGDLYVSFKGQDGKWGKAKNLGRVINSSGNEFTPVVSPDGKYLFFASDRTGNDDIYWIDMGRIDKSRGSAGSKSS